MALNPSVGTRELHTLSKAETESRADTKPRVDTEREDSLALHAVRLLVQAWVFLVVLALYPYTANPAAPIKNLLTGWSTFFICTAYFYGMVRERVGLRLNAGTFLVVAVFLGVHLLSAVCSDFPLNSVYSLRFWLCGGLIALMTGNAFRTTDQIWKLILTVVIAVSCSSIYGYLQKFGMDPFPWSARDIEEYAGMPSTYANPNFAGHTLMLATFMATGLLIFKRKWICLAELALIGSHLYLTHMRGARVAIVASLILLAVYYLLRTPRRSAVRAGALAVGALLFVSMAGAGAALALANMRTEGTLPLDTPSVLRLNGYYGAARLAMENPVLGIGPGNFDLESPMLWTPFEQRWYATEGKKNDHVHNDALEAAAEAGIPGVTMYFALLLWGVLGALALKGDNDKPDRAKLGIVLAGCIGAFAVDGLFGFNLRVPVSGGLFFLMIGMLHALLHRPAAWRAGQVAVQAALVLLALGLALWNTAGFAAETKYQEARGAQAYAEKSRTEGNMAQVEYGYRAGRDLLAAASGWLPFEARFPELRGAFAIALGDLDGAEADLKAAIDRNPFNPATHVARARLHASRAFQRDELDVFGAKPDPEVAALASAAAAAAKSALALCPVLPTAEEVLGRVAFAAASNDPEARTQRLLEAREALERALLHGAKNRAEINRVLALVYAAQGESDNALLAFRRAVEYAPADEALWDAFQAFAMTAQRSKELVDALNARIATLRNSDPTLADALTLRLAYVYVYSVGKRPLGVALARETAQRAPAQGGAWGLLATGAGDYSASALRAALDEHDGARAPEWVRVLSGADTPDGFHDALAKLREAVEAAGHTESAAMGRDFVWAARLLERALPALALDDAARGAALGHIAQVFAHCGRWKEAERAATAAAPLLGGEDAAIALLPMAEALGARGDFAGALAAARKAAALSPTLRARVALARALADAGRDAEAQFEYTSLLSSTPANAPERAEVERGAARLAARQAAAGGSAS